MSQGNASSSRFNDIKRLETEPESLLELKDAIIELYLAIKIRSTEEVSSSPGLCLQIWLSQISSLISLMSWCSSTK